MSRKLRALFDGGRFPALLTLYVVCQPLLDAATGWMAQSGSALTVGTVVRILFLAGACLYLLLCGPFPGKKGILVCLWTVTGYLAVFFLWSFFRGGFSLFLKNAQESMKVFYFLYTALLLYALYRQRGFLVPLWAAAAAGAGYCLIIVAAYVTGTSFVSYNAGYGYCGWFYSANDVSNIVLLTAPLLLYLCFTRLTTAKGWAAWVGICVLLFSVVFSACFIGTKLVFLGVLVYAAAAACWLLAWLLLRRDRRLLRPMIAAVLLCVLLLGLYPVSPLNDYITDIYIPMSGEDQAAYEASQAIPGLVEVDRAKKHAEMEAAAEGTWLGEAIQTNPLVKKLDWILSRRLLAIAPILQEYLDGDAAIKLLGLGYGQTASYQKEIGQLVEMEPLALLLRHGVVGFVLFYVPFLAAAVYLIVSFFRRLKGWMAGLRGCSLLYGAMVALAASVIVGHILETPSVSLFAAMIYAQALRCAAPGALPDCGPAL